MITDNFFIEAQYSKKEYAFLGSGSSWYDLINGTLVQDRARGTRYWSPTFRVKPEGERRDNELWSINGTYFLSTEGFGTHELKAGYEHFNEVRAVNNYQNGSDYRVSLYQTIVRGDEIYPRVRTGSNTRIYWYPIFVLSEGSNYGSDALYINDRWVASPRWTFNLGVRCDKNDAVSGDGSYKVADDSNISPRLGANWDVLGDGKLKITGSYGKYVGRLAEGVGNDGDPAGRTASFNWVYGGPAINDNVNTPTDELVGTAEALEIIFDWFFANGGTDMRPFRTAPSIPGLQTVLDPNGLKSPNVQEWTLGLGAALGQKGIVRADFVYRESPGPPLAWLRQIGQRVWLRPLTLLAWSQPSLAPLPRRHGRDNPVASAGHDQQRPGDKNEADDHSDYCERSKQHGVSSCVSDGHSTRSTILSH